jgi:tricorn protease
MILPRAGSLHPGSLTRSEGDERVAESCYLRYPHAARDLVTFAAQDDVWLASLSEAAGGRGARAWRLTADQAPLLHPRLNPSATHVAWTSTRDGSRSLGRGAAREAYAVPTGGGPPRRLTYWGERFATVRGWVSDNEVLVLSRAGQHSSMKTWAFAVSLSGQARRLGSATVRRATSRYATVPCWWAAP